MSQHRCNKQRNFDYENEQGNETTTGVSNLFWFGFGHCSDSRIF